MSKKIDNSENRNRVLFTVIALFCLLLNVYAFYSSIISMPMTTDDCLWTSYYEKNPNISNDSSFKGLLITNIIPNGVADKAGIKENDILLAINDIKINNTKDGMDILNSFRNETIYYKILRGTEILDVPIYVYKFLNVLFLIFWALGVGFLIVGYIVGFSKPKESISKIFLFLGCTASLSLILWSGSNIFTFDSSNSYSFVSIFNILIIGLQLISLYTFPSILLHFFLTYPLKYELKNRKLIIFFVYLFPFLFFGFNILLNLYILKTPILTKLTPSYIIPIIYITIGMIAFEKSYKKIKDLNLKKSLIIIRKGFVIAGIGFLYYLIMQFFFSKPIFLIQKILLFPILLVLAIPISFGYSIIKYRILDTEYIIKKSLVYTLLTAIIVVIYLVLVLIVDKFFSEYIQKNRQLLTISFIIIVTFTFDFVNNRAKDVIEKIFYKEKYNYRKSLLAFTQELSFLNNVEDLINKISETVNNAMGIENIKLWIVSPQHKELLSNSYLKSDLCFSDSVVTEIFNKLFLNNNEPVQLTSAYFQDYKLTEEEISAIKKCNLSLSIPIIIDNKLIGALNFGPKYSGKAYSDEDIDLLKSFALHSATVLENARLEIFEMKKKKIDEELNIAKKIQMDLLPKKGFANDWLEITGISKPAEIIGGDFYDIIEVNENKLLTVVADVSGKGIPAALYMSKIQAMLKYSTTLYEHPKDILIEVNKQIFEQIEKKYFITIALAAINLKEKTIQVCRAGHTPPLLYKNNKVTEIIPKGMGIGLERGKLFEANLEEKTIILDKNTSILIYSDGLTECMNEKNEEYGLEKLKNIFLSSQNLGINKIKGNIINELSNFRLNKQQNDDITFLLIKTKT